MSILRLRLNSVLESFYFDLAVGPDNMTNFKTSPIKVGGTWGGSQSCQEERLTTEEWTDCAKGALKLFQTGDD